MKPESSSSSLGFVLPSGMSDPFAKIKTPLVLLLDVDGVTRASVEKRVDEAVMAAVNKLLSLPAIAGLYFLSGSPIDNDDSIDEWRRGNLPLQAAFSGCFTDMELRSGRVGIYGQVGTQRLCDNATVETLDAFSSAGQHFVACTLLQHFLEAASNIASLSAAAGNLLTNDLQALRSMTVSADARPSKCTPDLFFDLVRKIRALIDPTFRLVSSESLAEFHMDPRLAGGIEGATRGVRLSCRRVPELVKASVFSGVAHRGTTEFAFLLVTLSNKGKAASAILDGVNRARTQKGDRGRLCTVTIGDGGVDYPMHVLADASFHVGPRRAWDAGAELCDTVLVVSKKDGAASQHVQGTEFVLMSIYDKLCSMPMHKL